MSAIDVKDMDLNVSPGDSFYRYCNGGWLKSNEIPPEFSTWNSFRILDEESKKNLKAIFDDLTTEAIGSSLIAELYLSGMNTDLVEQAGITGIQKQLQEIDSIDNLDQIFRFAAYLHKKCLKNVFFYLGPQPDARKSTWNVLSAGQSGLGLPDRDYYFDDSKEEQIKKYQLHIKNVLVLGGTDGTIAETSATDVYEFEKRIAEFSLPMQERRDPVKTYNKVTTTQLKETAPAIPWDSFFEHVGLIGDFGDLVLENVAYFSKLSELLLKTNLEIIKVYLKYHFLHSCSPFLNEAFVNEHFEFTEKALKGTASIQLRWKRILSQVSENLEDDVSKLYVAKHFPPESKKAASEMVQYIIKAFEHRLKTVDWMQDETRKKGLEKLAKFGVKIGYPDKWKDYSSLQGKLSRSTSYIENMLIVREFNYNMEMKHTNNAVDRLKWELPPFTVNAYFHPMLNEIVFPAAILQKPFFYAPTKENPFGDVALNFGGIGGVIAHEISHGYDDQGRQFNSEGNLVDWWTKEDAEQFTTRAKKIVQQFDQFLVLGKPVNGTLTQGENIADLGGVSVSFAAFQEFLKSNQLENHSTFTFEQQFFISWGQIWRNLIREQTALQYLITDPHSPGEFRVDGPLANLPEFHNAFDIKKGDRMYQEEDVRVSIW